MIVTERSIEAGWMLKHLDEQQRDELCQLAIDHGLSPDCTSTVTYDVTGEPLLRFVLFDKDDEGCPRADSTGSVVTFEVEKPLAGTLPAWWQPCDA